MFTVEFRMFKGEGDYQENGRFRTYEQAIDSVLDIRNLLRVWGEAEIKVSKGGKIIKMFILDENGLSDITTTAVQ